MASEDDSFHGGFNDRTSSGRRAIDWIIAGLLTIVGLATIAIGWLVFQLADRDRIEELVMEETIESDIVTEAELIDGLFAGTYWGGIGVVLAGVVILIIGVLAGYGRYRIDQGGDEPVRGSYASNGLIGAVVTVVTSFIPFSGLIGGGIAGYIHTDDGWNGALVGGFAGILLAIPVSIVALFIVIGVALEGLGIVSIAILIALLFGIAFHVAVSAIGGAIGSYIRSRG